METTLRCARCEYDLRLLDRAGVCPECALPIPASVVAAAEAVDPAARRSIYLGATMLATAMAVRFALWIGLVIHGYATNSSELRDHLRSVRDVLAPWPAEIVVYCARAAFQNLASPWTFARAVLLIALATQMIGMWWMTRPAARSRANSLLRLAARWLPIASVAYFAGVISLQALAGSGTLWFASEPIAGVVRLAPAIALALWAWNLTLAISGGNRRGVHGLGLATTAMVALAGITVLSRILGWISWSRTDMRFAYLALELPPAVLAFALLVSQWFVLQRRSRGPSSVETPTATEATTARIA